jgi:hypothetical protein
MPMSDDCDVGVLVAGPVSAPRHLVEHRRTLEAFTDGNVEFDGEAYLSHYIFGEELEQHYAANRNSVAGFVGPCRVAWLLWDIDEHDPVAALTSARRLVAFIQERYHTDPACWFSGAKGYHIALRLAHDPSPSATFPTVARSFAEALAAAAGVRVDSALYDLNRVVRLPNTRHAKSGLFKVPLLADELGEISVEAVRQRAQHPRGMPLPVWRGDTDRLVADWTAAEAVAGRVAEARAERRATFTPDERAPRFFLEFLRFGAPVGERATMLFRCAAWLSEQGCPEKLVSALLTEPGLDCGLSPSETARQIRCGNEHAQRQRGAVNAVAAEASAAAPAQAPAVAEAEACERWCVQHEADPWPTPTFDFGANTPTERARWQAVLQRLTGDPQAVQQALQQLSIPDADLTRPAKGRLPT